MEQPASITIRVWVHSKKPSSKAAVFLDAEKRKNSIKNKTTGPKNPVVLSVHAKLHTKCHSRAPRSSCSTLV